MLVMMTHTQISSCTLRLFDPEVGEGGVPVALDGVAPVGLCLPVPHHHHLHLHEGSHQALILSLKSNPTSAGRRVHTSEVRNMIYL